MTVHLDAAEAERLNALGTIDDFPAEHRRATLHPATRIERGTADGSRLVATGPIAEGETVIASDGERYDRAITYSIQVEADEHMMGAGALNHRCVDPSCVVDPATGDLVAARDLAAGDALDFNYLTTEWCMATPFACRCGSALCWGEIAGFSALPVRHRRLLASTLPIAMHLSRRIAKRT